jgi:hypothetical protein
MATLCAAPTPSACTPAITDPRVLAAFAARFNTSTRQALVSIPLHTKNGDETLADKCGTYAKALKHTSPGKVDLIAYNGFINAIASGTFAAFEGLIAGGSRTQNGPLGSYAKTFFGADSSQFGDLVVPTPWKMASVEYAAELVELYWCSLLRDVTFMNYHSNAVAVAAASELTTIPGYKGPKDDGTVSPALLFRGQFAGETIGPYVSQFLLTPTNFGPLNFDQKYATYAAGVDYMTDEPTFFDVQQGIPTGVVDQKDPVARYLHNGRGLAAWTHVDELFQAYFTAYLVLESTKTPRNPGNPYAASKKQNGFGTFGGPDFAAVLAQVAKVALNAVWYQKWVIHLRHRPESGAGLVHYSEKGVVYSAKPHANVFTSKALAASKAKYSTALLSQPFPEGSPAHPAYPTGHGAVAGACITVLKFFYDGGYAINNPQVASADGLKLEPWNFDPQTGDPGVLTVNGELHKLAHNITFGHGLHGGIHWRSDSDGSMMLGEAVALSFLQDLACTYAEQFSVTLTKLDGTTATVTNM